MFHELDSQHDELISFEEFQLALKKIESWGIQITNARAAYDEIDKDHNGMLTFDEFAVWAISNSLHFIQEHDDDVTGLIPSDPRLSHSPPPAARNRGSSSPKKARKSNPKRKR